MIEGFPVLQMSNAFALFRSLVIYGVCLPLAIFIGYLLATPDDFASLSVVSLLLALMTIPLFLRWHYPLLILSLNMAGGFYLLPGQPTFALVMIGVSLGISVLGHVMNRNLKFMQASSVAWSLIFLTAVILGTAKLTGGIGLKTFGSDAIGGKHYVYLLAGIAAFFAITARSIPPKRAGLYLALFLAAPMTAAIGELVSVISPNLYFIFWFFPPDMYAASAFFSDAGILRLAGIGVASAAGINLLLAHYGIQGVLDLRRGWRFPLFCLLLVGSTLGGFRSTVISVAMTLMIVFYLEGLMRSRLLPAVILATILAGTLIVPFSDRLPLSVQRSLAFLPLKLDPEAELSALDSVNWRLQIWNDLLPTIPQYLVVGKGLGIDARDLALLADTNRGSQTGDIASLAGDYHSGPLSLIIPFGLGGVVGFFWFLFASIRVLHKNYQFGDPEYRRYNRFLLSFFLANTFMFFFIVGSFYSGMATFAGIVGLSVALNHGVRSSSVVELEAEPFVHKFKLAGAAR
jgi:hypothetical protein